MISLSNVLTTGKILSLAFTDLAAVAIETNDSGPWGADVWWLLFDKSENLGCAFPQGAKGEDQAVNRLTSLPGFDHQKMIEAMGSTDNALYLVWRAPGVG